MNPQRYWYVDLTDVPNMKEGVSWMEFLAHHPAVPTEFQEGIVVLVKMGPSVDVSISTNNISDDFIRKTVENLMEVIRHEMMKFYVESEHHKYIARLTVATEHWDWQLKCEVTDQLVEE